MGSRRYQGGRSRPRLFLRHRYDSSLRGFPCGDAHTFWMADAGVEIISVSPHDISQTYTFDAPTSFSPSPSINNMKVRRKLSIGNRRLSLIGSTFGLGGGPGTLSRTSSTTSSDSNDSIGSAVTFASSSDSSNGYRTLESHICMRDALVYAREQLIRGTEMKRAGGNVLFFEGCASFPFLSFPFFEF